MIQCLSILKNTTLKKGYAKNVIIFNAIIIKEKIIMAKNERYSKGCLVN